MDLSNISTADIKRIDEDANVHVQITLNLVVGDPWKADFYISAADIANFKNGTAAQKKAIRKKYIRQAVQNYLDATKAAPVSTVQGTVNVPKNDFSDAGDT